MTTQELVERMNERARRISGKTAGPFDVIDNPTADLLRAAASRLSEMDAENKRLRELLADALGMASQHRVAALDAEHGARGDRTRPASDADWYAFQDRIRAALAGAR